MSLNKILFNNSDPDWSNYANIATNIATDWLNRTLFQGNASDSIPWDQTPQDIRQYILICRLILLGIGLFGSIFLLTVYVKCSSIIQNCLGIYVVNLCLATLIDMIDSGIWIVKEFGYQIEDYELPWWVYKIFKLPQFGQPTASLLFTLIILDRFFATFFSNCHHGCFGSKINAIFLSLIIWLGSFFMVFILIFEDLLFKHDKLYELLQFSIAYLGPFVLKLFLVLLLFIKRRMVPDSEQSQAFINRQRETLYYCLAIVSLHLILSVPYLAFRTNNFFHLVEIRLDQWIFLASYMILELPLILNPILVLTIDPEFRDSMIYVCTCASRAHRDLTDLCDDHAESQPLAPMATSPIAEEKEHLDEAES